MRSVTRHALSCALLALALGWSAAAFAENAPLIDLTQGLELPSFALPTLDDVPTGQVTDPDFADCFQSTNDDELVDPLSCLGSGVGSGAPRSGTLPGGGVLGEDQGVVDVIFSGSEYALQVPWVISVFMPPVVHLTHYDTYYDCLDEIAATPGMRLSDCSERWQAATPAAPPAQQERFNDAVEEAWRTFERKMIDDLHRALNRLPACMTPPGLNCISMLLGAPPIFPVPDMACVIDRIMSTYPQSFVEHYPEFWASIAEAVVEHLPNTVAYGLTLNPIDPLDGSLVAPIYSPVPDIAITLEDMGLPFTFDELRDEELLRGLSHELRREIYYHEPFLALLGLNINVPVLPGELQDAWPGIEPLEHDKVELGIATAMQYEFKGYTVLNQLYTDRRVHWFFETTWRAPFYRPALQIRCIFPPIRTPLGIPIPVPGYMGVPELDEISVPEGYLIPRTGGESLWTPWP